MVVGVWGSPLGPPVLEFLGQKKSWDGEKYINCSPRELPGDTPDSYPPTVRIGGRVRNGEETRHAKVERIIYVGWDGPFGAGLGCTIRSKQGSGGFQIERGFWIWKSKRWKLPFLAIAGATEIELLLVHHPTTRLECPVRLFLATNSKTRHNKRIKREKNENKMYGIKLLGQKKDESCCSARSGIRPEVHILGFDPE